MQTKKVAIVFHSGFGHTTRMAQAVQEGVLTVPNVEARLYPVTELDEAGWAELDGANAIIFGSPTYMGSAAAKMREFMETSSKRWYARAWKDKLAAGFTVSASQSGDKLHTLIELMVFANQHAMLWVGLDLLPGNNNSQGSVQDLNRLGSFSGAMAQANADQGADGMLESDLKTASRLGQRVAEQAMRLGY